MNSDLSEGLIDFYDRRQHHSAPRFMKQLDLNLEAHMDERPSWVSVPLLPAPRPCHAAGRPG